MRIACAIMLLSGLLLAGCTSEGQFMSEIEAHSEDSDIRAQALLKDDPSLVRYKDSKGHTPLHVAADSCNQAVANLLVKAGADVNAQDNEGNTPLILCVKPHIIEELSAPDKRADMMNVKLLTRLQQDNRGIIGLLQASKADPNLKNKAGQSYASLTQGQLRFR